MPDEHPFTLRQVDLARADFAAMRFDDGLADNLARMPNGGFGLMKLHQERQQKLEHVLQLADSGHVAEARYLSEMWCLNIPDAVFTESQILSKSR